MFGSTIGFNNLLMLKFIKLELDTLKIFGPRTWLSKNFSDIELYNNYTQRIHFNVLSRTFKNIIKY